MKPARVAFQKVMSLFLLTALLMSALAIFPADLALAGRLSDQQKQEGFPGLPFVAPSVDAPQTPALYWAEGNNSVELLPLKGMTTNDKIDYRLSADSQT